MAKKRFKANTELLPSNYDDFFNKVYQNGNKYKDLSDNVFDKTETRRLDFDSHNQDELTGNENPFTSQFGNSNAEDPYNEYRANNQSGLDHLGIGLVRTAAKAATEVAKLPGVIGGIGIMAADGLTGGNLVDENEGFETAFNNQWIKYFDSLNEDVKEALPVYTKEAVKNGDFFDKVSSSAFWAEDGADGAGFMLGMMAPGAIFKFAGGANALFGASIKAAKLAKYGENIQTAGKLLEKAGITVKNIDQYMIPAFNTFAEAGAEAKGVSDDLESRKPEAYKIFQQQQLNDLKNLDLQRRSGKIDIKTYNELSAEVGNRDFESQFKEQKALAMQNTFVKNVAILAVPNYIQSKMLFGKTPSKVLLDKIGGLTEKSVKNTVKQVGKRIGQSFLSEGSEEIGQTAVQNRNISQALQGKLGDNRTDDYNPLTFGEDFVKTLGTTEGQIAGFLGGIMGSPISTVTGYHQDIADRKQTERLRDKINGESTVYQDVVKTNIYEQEQYTNPETGEVSTRDKIVDGKKVFIPEAVAKVKNALDLTEQQSQIYDKAIQEGDTNTIEYLKSKAEFNLIQKFIGEDQVTLDALNEYLKVAFPTETSKNISEEQVKLNKENIERVDKIMKKATTLQKDLTSYKDMAASIIRINNPEVTPEHLSDFMNRVANTFMSERAEEFDAKDKLNKLEKQRADLEANSSVIEIDNPNYIEGISSELDKTTKTRSNNPRLDLINSQIAKVKEQLKDLEESTNSTIWDNEYLNNKINNEVIAKKKLQQATSPEVVAKADEVSQLINNAATPEELDNLPKTNTPADKILQQRADEKKFKLKEVKDAEEAGTIADAKDNDTAFNGTSKTDMTSTEGSVAYDELTPKTGENTTPEEDKEAKVIDPTEGKGVKLISYDRKNNKVLDFIEKQFPEGLAFERNPVNKIGNEVGFEINENPGVKLAEDALKQFKASNFKDIQFLIDYLPINIKLADGAYLPIETRRVNGEINPETEMLRKSLITNLINGIPIEGMSSTITGQYKGVLQVESPTAENILLDLAGVTDLKYIKDNTYFVNIHGQLENILTGQTRPFQNKFTKDLDRTKNYAAGEIYLIIPQADGISQFPLKLNISKLSIEESEGLFEIYKEILTQDKGSNTTLSEISPELLSVIQNIFGEELKVIAPVNKQKDIKLGEIIDLLVYESENPKSRINITDGILYFGDQSVHSDEIDSLKEEIMYFLHTQKRHQIKIRPKTAEDNQRTNLSSNSADYIKYLVNNKILSTNAVINQPAFQGYTNLFINPSVQVKGSKKVVKESTIKDKKDELDNNIEKIQIPRYFTFGELGSKPGTRPGETIESEKNAEIQKNLEKQLKEGDKLIEPNGDIFYYKNGTVVKPSGQPRGFKDIGAFLHGVTIERNKTVFTNTKSDIERKRQYELENKGKVKVSDAGVEIANKNLEGLDFGDNKIIENISKGILKNNIYTLKNGEKYSLNIMDGINGEIKSINDRENKERLSFSIRNENNENIGNITFWKDKDGLYYSNNTTINEKYQRKGIATATYDYAEKLGIIIKSSKIQTKMGESFFNTRLLRKTNPNFNPKNIIKTETFDYKTGESTVILENNINNTRHIENKSLSLPESTTVIEDLANSNKFVSSSDIPNTVENKQQMNKQKQVFKEPKGLEGQKDTKTITLLNDKVEKGTATEANLKQLENLKDKYGEEYVKKCK